MTPQKKKALGFFGLMVLVSMGIVVWNFFLNRGWLLIEGPTPFTVNVGKIRDAQCKQTPCRYQLKPGRYTAVIKKENFQDIRETVEVRRAKETNFAPVFQFIPTLKNLGPYQPNKYLLQWETNGLDFGPKFPWENIALNKISKNADKVIFNLDGTKAYSWIGKEIYRVSNVSVEKTDLYSRAAALAWRNQSMLILTRPSKDEKQKLLLSEGDKDENIIVAFDRALENPEIFTFQWRQNIVFLLETLSENHYRLYQIDIQQKSKARVELPEKINKIRPLNADMIIFETNDGVFIKSLTTNREQKIQTSLDHVIDFGLSDSLIFVSHSPANSLNTESISFKEVLESTAENLKNLSPKIPSQNKKWFLIEWNFKQNTYRDLGALDKEDGVDLYLFPLQQQNAEANSEEIYFLKQKGNEKTLMVLELKPEK